MDRKKVLVIGIGNSGRGDDGLGWRFTDLVADEHFENIDCEYRYQLQVEDALLIGGYDVVVFADATQDQPATGFSLGPCSPAPHYFFSSHAQSPETILYLARELYDRLPEAYILAISGKEWDMKCGMSDAAEKRLAAAFAHFKDEWVPRLWRTDVSVA